MFSRIISQAKPKMELAIEALSGELKKIRTSRADVSLIEGVKVPYYGSLTPLQQVASISIPEPNLIVIQVWDKDNLAATEQAIRDAKLGLEPVNDGKAVRISTPPLTSERREEYLKIVHTRAEETRVALRNIREEAWKEVKAEERAGRLSEDDRYRGEEELNKLIKEMDQKIATLIGSKEKDIRGV